MPPDEDALLAALAECFPDVSTEVLLECLRPSNGVLPDAIDAVLARLVGENGALCDNFALSDSTIRGSASVRPTLREAFWRAKRAFPDAEDDIVAALVEACAEEGSVSDVYAAVARSLRESGLGEPLCERSSIPRKHLVSHVTPAIECASPPPPAARDDSSKPSLAERLETYFNEYGSMPDLSGDDLLERAAVLRDLASDTHDMRAAASLRARQAHVDGGLTGRSVAAFMGARARGLHDDAAALNRAAAALVFYAWYVFNTAIDALTLRNAEDDPRVVDLHGLTVAEATAIAVIHLDVLRIDASSPVRIVTGAGRHSGRAGARLRPAIQSLLLSRRLCFAQDAFGTFTVRGRL